MTSRNARREADRKLRATMIAGQTPDAELHYLRSGGNVTLTTHQIAPPELGELVLGLFLRFDPVGRGQLLGAMMGLMQGTIAPGQLAAFVATGQAAPGPTIVPATGSPPTSGGTVVPFPAGEG